MSTKENYEKRMEEIIRKNTGKGKMRLLLHACCAPCSSAILESLAEFFSISVFFYNPNIDREEEFNRRAEECRRLVEEMPGVSTCIVTNYIHDAFLLVAKGLEREPERGARCTACFKLRLEETAAFASRWNIEHPEEKYEFKYFAVKGCGYSQQAGRGDGGKIRDSLSSVGFQEKRKISEVC